VLCNLAEMQAAQVQDMTGHAGVLTQAIGAYEQALTVFRHRIRGDEVRICLAELYCQRAKEIPGTTGASACDDYSHALAYLDRPLKRFTDENYPQLYRRGAKAQREAQAGKRQHNCQAIPVPMRASPSSRLGPRTSPDRN
jgi:hypothetical protein